MIFSPTFPSSCSKLSKLIAHTLTNNENLLYLVTDSGRGGFVKKVSAHALNPATIC